MSCHVMPCQRHRRFIYYGHVYRQLSECSALLVWFVPELHPIFFAIFTSARASQKPSAFLVEHWSRIMDVSSKQEQDEVVPKFTLENGECSKIEFILKLEGVWLQHMAFTADFTKESEPQSTAAHWSSFGNKAPLFLGKMRASKQQMEKNMGGPLLNLSSRTSGWSPFFRLCFVRLAFIL